MPDNRYPSGGLREQILARFYRRILTGEPRSTARQIAKELGIHYNYDSRVEAEIQSYARSRLLLEFPIEPGEESPTYEITKQGAFILWDSLVSSQRLDGLPNPDKVVVMNYTDEKQKAAEELFVSWFTEWKKKRDTVPVRVTNKLIASGP